MRLITPFLAGTGLFEGMVSERARLLQAASAQIRLTPGEEPPRKVHSATAGRVLYRPFEQPHGLVDTPGQDIRRAQEVRYDGDLPGEFHFLTETQSAFEHRQGLMQLPFADVETANSPIGHY